MVEVKAIRYVYFEESPNCNPFVALSVVTSVEKFIYVVLAFGDDHL